MSDFKNVMEVFKLLDKSNCKKCDKPTCLAFAAAVFQGQVRLSDCPSVDKAVLERYGTETRRVEPKIEQDYLKRIEEFKQAVATIDISSKASTLGGVFLNNRITLKIFGKDFSIDANGNISTDIHVNPWITLPVYNYVIHGAGLLPTGEWVSFRDLKGGREWLNFFDHQCVNPMKKVADTYPLFFEDIIRLFNGRQVENLYQSDISLVIHPLPRVPLLICYNHPEDGLESSLKLFFDRTADENLLIESIYGLCTGLTRMFEKLAVTHG